MPVANISGMAYAKRIIKFHTLLVFHYIHGDTTMKKKSGFTLIEIAIVLVIIGLLLGGVLKGQEMMTNAKIKRISNDFNGISAAIFSYLDRYSAFPGDDPNANDRWGGAIADGNGNGLVSTGERADVWDHLRQSGLVAGTGNANPTHAFGGTVQVQQDGAGINGMVICMLNMPGKTAEILDRQIDDGNGNTGEFRQTANSATYDQNVTDLTVCKKL